MSYDGLRFQFSRFYKAKYLPRLLKEECDTVPESDKSYIRNMLTKPFSLYVFRHSSLTEKSQILKEHVLRNHAGWSMNSKMPQLYIHYFGNESVNSLLEAKGFTKKEDKIRKNSLQPKYCTNCNESNKPDSRFCIKCKMVLSYDAYNETLTNQKAKEDRITVIENQLKTLIATLNTTNDQAHVDKFAPLCSPLEY